MLLEESNIEIKKDRENTDDIVIQKRERERSASSEVESVSAQELRFKERYDTYLKLADVFEGARTRNLETFADLSKKYKTNDKANIKSVIGAFASFRETLGQENDELREAKLQVDDLQKSLQKIYDTSADKDIKTRNQGFEIKRGYSDKILKLIERFKQCGEVFQTLDQKCGQKIVAANSGSEVSKIKRAGAWLSENGLVATKAAVQYTSLKCCAISALTICITLFAFALANLNSRLRGLELVFPANHLL